MSQRVWSPISIILLVTALLLVSCGGGVAPPTEPPTESPVASIYYINHSPTFPADGETVTFTVGYQNSSSTESLSGVMLEVNYDQNLTYSGFDSTPVLGDAFEDKDNHSLTWNLGDLPPGQPQPPGTVEVRFVVSNPTSTEQFELSAKISGATSQATSTASMQIVIFPEGKVRVTHQEGVYEVYPEGVSVWLPLQNSQNSQNCYSSGLIHSEKSDVDLNSITKNVQDGVMIRPVIYLEVFNDAGEPVNCFSPAIRLTADYTADDSIEAGSTDELFILVYDSVNDIWILCDGELQTDQTLCSKTEILTPGQNSGSLSVNIDKWTSGTALGKR